MNSRFPSAAAACLAACLFFALGAKAEEQAVAAVETTLYEQSDYIRASLLVIDPSHEVYSLFGHCALRLECPTQQMDYCFTFETSTDTQGLANFMRGSAMGGFMASSTAAYFNAYRNAGRGVTEYELNLTPKEKLLLWEIVDDELLRGYNRHYDYLHTQCTSMVVYLVKRALRLPVVYNDLPEALGGSFRDVMFAVSRHPWSNFFWQTVMGPSADASQPMEHKLVPVLLAQAWQQATVGNGGRQLIACQGQRIVDADANAPLGVIASPVVVFSLLLLVVILITLGQLRASWRIVPLIADVVLLIVHTAISLVLLWLVFFSSLEGTQWNWYLPAFNPLFQLLWLAVPAWRVWVVRCCLCVFVLTMVLTPLIPQLDLSHALLIACMAVRLLSRADIKTQTSF